MNEPPVDAPSITLTGAAFVEIDMPTTTPSMSIGKTNFGVPYFAPPFGTPLQHSNDASSALLGDSENDISQANVAMMIAWCDSRKQQSAR
jgi:hypothetical protein